MQEHLSREEIAELGRQSKALDNHAQLEQELRAEEERAVLRAEQAVRRGERR